MAVYEIGGYEVPPSLLASLHSLPQLPQFPEAPLGAFTDALFEAEDAQAQAAYKRRYADVLRQLGYVDPATGKILKGSLELEADRQRADLWRSSELAKIDAINEAQVAGNYFSGYHPVNQARKQFPFIQGITDINVGLPKALAAQMEEATRAFEEYILGRNLSLAQAAARAAEAARNQPAGGGDLGQGTQAQWDWEEKTYGWNPGNVPADYGLPPGFNPLAGINLGQYGAGYAPPSRPPEGPPAVGGGRPPGTSTGLKSGTKQSTLTKNRLKAGRM